jgi:hypothetical protein
MIIRMSNLHVPEFVFIHARHGGREYHTPESTGFNYLQMSSSPSDEPFQSPA